MAIDFDKELTCYLSKFVVGSSKASIEQLIEKASAKAILITILANTFYPKLLLPFISISLSTSFSSIITCMRLYLNYFQFEFFPSFFFS